MDKTWQAVLIALIALAVTGIGVWVFSPKNVDYYYASSAGGETLGFCVYAHWTWHVDEIAYCSDDKNNVLDFVARANATIPRK